MVKRVDFPAAFGKKGAGADLYIACDVFGAAVDEVNGAGLFQSLNIDSALHDTAAGRNDEAFPLCESFDGAFFGITEAVFAHGEELGNALSFFFFQIGVGIHKGAVQGSGQSPPQCGFPAAGHADQDDIFHECSFGKMG